MHELDAGTVHYEWNNAIPPRLRIDPGDTVVFQTRDAADGYYSRASTHADVANRGPFRGHPLTIKQLTRDSTLYLPVWMPGALFSVGDGHGAQGDGEVCVTAVEMQAQVTLRFGLERGRHLPEPQLRTSRRLASGTNTGPWFATTAHGPDLFTSSQRAVLHMIDHLVRERGFSRDPGEHLSVISRHRDKPVAPTGRVVTSP